MASRRSKSKRAEPLGNGGPIEDVESFDLASWARRLIGELPDDTPAVDVALLPRQDEVRAGHQAGRGPEASTRRARPAMKRALSWPSFKTNGSRDKNLCESHRVVLVEKARRPSHPPSTVTPRSRQMSRKNQRPVSAGRACDHHDAPAAEPKAAPEAEAAPDVEESGDELFEQFVAIAVRLRKEIDRRVEERLRENADFRISFDFAQETQELKLYNVELRKIIKGFEHLKKANAARMDDLRLIAARMDDLKGIRDLIDTTSPNFHDE